MAPTSYDLQRTHNKSGRNSGATGSSRKKSTRERGWGLGLNCSAEFCRGVVAECLGTFFFMIVACVADLQWDSSVRVDVLRLSFTLGLAVVTLVHCFEHISGAHLNPAVTASLMIIRQTGIVKGLFFIAAQFLGASVAVLLLKGFLPTSILGNMGYTVVSPQITAHQAMGLEFLMSFLFVFTFVSSMEATRFAAKLVALPIGLAYLLNTLWGYEFTGASMNPARTISAAVVQSNTNDWPVILEVYLAGPVAGGLVAALIYKFIFDPTFVPGSMRSLRSTSNFDSEEDSMIAMQPVSPHRKEDRGTRGMV
ncbi:aquaporin AQPAe.a-like [Patiria miniata]|uniref:Aquaporin n=1 Tax=Patiria miniata TaxID=46514 RepID=A0A913ZJ13_PATMI|nr:aquaporin AQPAe.a-like [Patiria miniata]